jgi:hypothetical protein
VSKTSRSIFDALRLALRAQPRSRNFKLGHDQPSPLLLMQRRLLPAENKIIFAA